MALRARRAGGNGLEAWPGYVDALSTLLMVVMFVLLVFVLAQALQSVVLSKRNDELTAANQTLTRNGNGSRIERLVNRLNQNLAAGRRGARGAAGAVAGSEHADRQYDGGTGQAGGAAERGRDGGRRGRDDEQDADRAGRDANATGRRGDRRPTSS